jgi:hypothetical protein
MNASAPASSRLPHGVLASTVIGIAAAAGGWLVSGLGPALTTSYARLDQLSALLVGGIVGAAVIGARAFRRREDVWYGGVAGALLGGVGALCGASLFAFLHAPVSPRTFLVERGVAWGCSCGGATVLLAIISPGASRRIVETALIGSGGGAIAGVIFTLPGASEVWQAVAMLWFGGTIGFAVAGPELWHAIATVELLPARGKGPSLVTLREWPLHEGTVVALGEAQVACVGGRIALYPPAGGVVAAGRHVRHPTFVASSGTIAVGRTRYQVYIGKLVVTVGRSVIAQVPARLELVRCVAGNDVPCVRTRVTLDSAERAAAAQVDSAHVGDAWLGNVGGNALVAPGLGTVPGALADQRELTFGIGAIGVSALARSAAFGSVELDVGADRATVARLTWRPPLVAMPTFQAVADPSALSPALREVLLLGAGGAGNRPVIALVMVLLVAGIWLVTQRLGWRELAVAAPASRERSTTTRTGAMGAMTEEGPPRKPEDITNQTARRTALRR